MTLRPEAEGDGLKTLEDLFGQGQFWPNVDWDNTRAYSLGLGAIYINVAGRERYGVVAPGADYDALTAELQTKLEAFVDSTTGEHPVRRVYRRDEMYRSFDPDLIPDLRAANNLGYRVSWQTALGGIPSRFFDDNARKWSGDHCSLDPELVKGIFLSNRRFDAAGANITDLFPTILSLLNQPAPPGIDGRQIRLLEGSADAAGGGP
jgi:predicted AlkP superfamily phosphohydrolase/phosphomutase